jgi:alpha-tubulin suppressor-like RCC1 family protein
LGNPSAPRNGDDDRDVTTATPVAVQGLSGTATSISAGNNHTCVLISGGAVQCWGSNRDGQLGDGNIIEYSIPVTVSVISGTVEDISSGLLATCAVLSNGSIKCWGHELGEPYF